MISRYRHWNDEFNRLSVPLGKRGRAMCIVPSELTTLTGKVASKQLIGLDNEWCALNIDLDGPSDAQFFKPGQFFNLRAEHSDTLLGRPISAYRSILASTRKEFRMLIARKGIGTNGLADLEPGGKVELFGPLGNGFPEVTEDDKVCAVGGGIGIAPILSFYEQEFCQIEDLYICLKTYRHEDAFMHELRFLHGQHNLLEWGKTNLIAEDRPIGSKAMLDAILTADILKAKGYTKVFACGPKPMLKYVRDICRTAGVKAYLSLENYMACGVGACLGCTIPTTEGNKRCCKDGPVFDADILDPYFDSEERKPIIFGGGHNCFADFDDAHHTSTDVAGVLFEPPIIAASGTFGYGAEYIPVRNIASERVPASNELYPAWASRFGPLEFLGGICSKGLTLEPRSGNSGRRLYETPMGLMNSIGLENPGIPHFIEHELKYMLAIRENYGTKIIANLSGSDIQSYVKGAKLLGKTDVDMIELNISCPNVKAGGMAFGMEPDAAADITAAIKTVISSKPLIVKLTPNAPDLVGVAMAVREAGADALSLVNTFQALAIDVETGQPIFDNVCAGLSGPAIKPIALRMVYDVAKAMNQLPEDQQIPIIGIGGISTWRDVVEFIMAGATAVQIGTANFSDPLSAEWISRGLKEYMETHNFQRIEEFRGTLLK